jgi:hypothetical protein
MPPGVRREALTKKAGQFDVALQIDRSMKSPGLQPPD